MKELKFTKDLTLEELLSGKESAGHDGSLIVDEPLKAPEVIQDIPEPDDMDADPSRKASLADEFSSQIPAGLEDFLTVEDCSSFPIDRYMLTESQCRIAESILQVKRISEEMAGLHLDYLNATLLYGVPGTGKTTFGRYMAYKLHLPFAFLNFAALISGGIMGDTARNITRIFRFMRDKPAVFMLDEIDAVCTRRGQESSATGGELSRITITVMQELDKYKRTYVKPIILAATNVKETLDPALISRFAIKKEIFPWTNEEKGRYMRKFLRSLNIPFNEDNLDSYCSNNSTLQQREIEADLIHSIAEWISFDREKPFIISHNE